MYTAINAQHTHTPLKTGCGRGKQHSSLVWWVLKTQRQNRTEQTHTQTKQRSRSHCVPEITSTGRANTCALALQVLELQPPTPSGEQLQLNTQPPATAQFPPQHPAPSWCTQKHLATTSQHTHTHAAEQPVAATGCPAVCAAAPAPGWTQQHTA